ncbi:hypothetical protein BDW68DRAFT_136333 [Aspergillus falconensis]
MVSRVRTYTIHIFTLSFCFADTVQLPSRHQSHLNQEIGQTIRRKPHRPRRQHLELGPSPQQNPPSYTSHWRTPSAMATTSTWRRRSSILKARC